MLRTGIEENKLDEVMQILFLPSEPNEERLNIYKQRHREIYEKRSSELAEMMIDGVNNMVLRSGMYGGKSTEATLMLQKLQARGFSSTVLIAGVLGDDFTTSRCLEGDEAVLHAEMVLPDSIENIKAQILADKGDNPDHVVYFDEFSFVDVEDVQEVVEFCREENIKLIMAGLDNDYLGRELPPMTRFCSDEDTFVEHCKSFTSHQNDPETEVPIGTHTARYIRLPEGGYVLDMAALPL